LHLRSAKPRDIIAALGKQAGVELRLAEANHPPINIDIDRQPFWIALRQVCTQLGVAPTTTNIPDLIMLEPTDDWFKRPAHVSGPALFTADQLHHTRTIHASGTDRSDLFEFNFSACIDPSLRVMLVSPEVKLIEAKDDRGNSLLPAPADGEGMNAEAESGWQLSFGTNLMYPKMPGQRIARIRGTIGFSTMGRSEKWEVADFLKSKGVSKTVAGVRCTLNKVVKNGEDYKIDVTMQRDGTSNARWEMFSKLTYGGLIRMYDAAGRSLYTMDPGASSPQQQRIKAILTISSNDPTGGEKVGPPVRMVWEIPTELLEMRVPFEFVDLPMPN